MECPHHLAFLAMLLLGVLAGVASASYPSSDAADAAAPAPQRRSAGRRRTPPCDPDRLAGRVSDGCPVDAVAPTARCCRPLLAAGRSGMYADTGLECFCAMLITEPFQLTDMISATEAADMYFRCGGRHNVTVCFYN